MPKNILKVRIILWLILALIVSWFVYMKIAPGGEISYSYDFSRPGYFIDKFRPAERLEMKENAAIIKGEPVYFYLRLPRKFDRAGLTLKYRNSSARPVIESGLLMNNEFWQYDLKPLENKTIDRLALIWDKTEKQGVILLQRQKLYDGIEKFLENPPAREQIAVYNYNLNSPYFLADYRKQENEKVINRGLRGSYRFYTYIKDEALDYKFFFSGLSEKAVKEPVEALVFRDNQPIHSQGLADLSDQREISLKLDNLPEGVYKISVSAGGDTVTDKISYRQSKISFINKISFADGDEKNISLWSDGDEIRLQTINPAKLQTVSVGDQEIKIAKTYYQYQVRTEISDQPIKLEKDGIMISGNGVFSFEQAELFNPEAKKADAGLDINRAGINYVLAEYRIPDDEGSWKTARAEFNLAGAAHKQYGFFGSKEYTFLISIPGLRAEDENQEIKLKEIRFDLRGASLWQRLKRYFE